MLQELVDIVYKRLACSRMFELYWPWLPNLIAGPGTILVSNLLFLGS